MFIDLDQISSAATVLCDHDHYFFYSRSLNYFVKPLRYSLLSFILIIPDIILRKFIDLDKITLTVTFLHDPDLDFSVQGQ